MQELEILEKFKKKGFNQLSVDDLIIIQQSATWAGTFKQATNEDWLIYSEKAGEKLSHSDFNIKWGQKNRNSYSGMFNSVLRGDINKLLEFLKVSDLPSCRKALDSNNKTALHIASREGQLEIVKILIEKGWEIDCKDKHSTTPLHQASNLNHFETVSFLLESGADPAIKDSLGRNSLMYAVCGPGTESTSMLANIKEILLAKDYNGKSPLHYAVYNPHNKQSEIFHILVKLGVNVNEQDEQGKTPLHHACEGGKVKAIRWLIKHGANTSCKDFNLNTPQDLSANNNIKKLLSLCAGAERPESIQKSYSDAKFEIGSQNIRPITDPKPVFKERLINFLSQVQEAGIINKQHIKKPQLYSGNWMEGVLSPIGLFNELSFCSPSEAVIKVFNVLFPYSKPFPQPRETGIIIDEFFSSPYSKTRNETPIFIRDETESKKISIELEVYKKNLSSLKESIEAKEKSLSSVESCLKQKELEIEKLKNALLEKQIKIDELSDGIARKSELLEPERVKVLRGQLGEAESKFEEYYDLCEKLQRDLESRPENKDIREMIEKISQVEADNRNLRFKAGQIFLRSIENPEKPERHPGQIFVQDLEILKRLDLSLKTHPPGLKQRLIDADFDQDGKISKSEASKVFSSLDLPPQDIISLLRIVGYRQGNAVIDIKEIENLLVDLESKEKELHSSLFTRLLKKFNSNSLGIERAFAYLDINQDGQVTFPEFSEGCEKLKIDLNREDRHALFAVLDSDHNGLINLYELKTKLGLGESEEMNQGVKSVQKKIEKIKKLEIVEENEKMKNFNVGVTSSRVNGSLVVGVIKGREFGFNGAAVQVYIEGSERKIKTQTLTEKNPEWRFKGRIRIDAGLKMVSNDLSIELIANSGVQAWAKVAWNSVLDFPNVWASKDEYSLVDKQNQSRGFVTLHLMWVPVESLRNDANGNLQIRLDSFSGFPNSMIEFVLGKFALSKPLKKSEEFMLTNIQILGENPVPPLKCSILKTEDKALILSQNLSIELALASNTWTKSLKVPIGQGRELFISFKWEEFSPDTKAKIKAATKIQARFRGYVARKNVIISKGTKKVARKIFKENNVLYVIGCFQENNKTNIELHEVSDNKDFLDVVDQEIVENMNLSRILKNLKVVNEKIVLDQGKGVKEESGGSKGLGKIGEKKVARKVCRVNNELFVLGCFQRGANIKIELHQVSDNREFLDILDEKTVENSELVDLVPCLQVVNQKIVISEKNKLDEPLTEKKSKLLSRRVIKKNNRYYIISLLEIGKKIKVSLNLADDNKIPMYTEISSIEIEPSPLSEIFSNLQIDNTHKLSFSSQPGLNRANFILLSRKVLKLSGRYFMISVYDEKDQFRIVGNLADDPHKSMFELSSQILTPKQPLNEIFTLLKCTKDLQIALS